MRSNYSLFLFFLSFFSSLLLKIYNIFQKKKYNLSLIHIYNRSDNGLLFLLQPFFRKP